MSQESFHTLVRIMAAPQLRRRVAQRASAAPERHVFCDCLVPMNELCSVDEETPDTCGDGVDDPSPQNHCPGGSPPLPAVQGTHRIDTRGAAGGKIAGKCRSHAQNEHRGGEIDGIESSQSEEGALHQSPAGKGCRDSNCHACRQQEGMCGKHG
jgi:hypothetical protein